MRIINLIPAQRRPVFGEAHHLIDIYDENEMALVGKTFDEQQAFVERFEKYFQHLTSGSFEQILMLIPYFSWGDENSYWDQNFTLRSELESRPEYDYSRMYSFLSRFDFRKNVFADNLLERLEVYFNNEGIALPELNDELILTYFPNKDSKIQKLYGDIIDASLLAKLDEIASLKSDDAWKNIAPLMDVNYDNSMIRKRIVSLRSQ